MDCLWHPWQGSWRRDGHSGLADGDKGGGSKLQVDEWCRKGKGQVGERPPSMAEQVPAPSPSPNSSDCLGHSSLWASGQAAEFGLRVQCVPPAAPGPMSPSACLRSPVLASLQGHPAGFWLSACLAQPRPPEAPSPLARPLLFQLLSLGQPFSARPYQSLPREWPSRSWERAIIILSNIIKTN